jgi:hypothetical protein
MGEGALKGIKVTFKGPLSNHESKLLQKQAQYDNYS